MFPSGHPAWKLSHSMSSPTAESPASLRANFKFSSAANGLLLSLPALTGRTPWSLR
jgi:hypothetical protein